MEQMKLFWTLWESPAEVDTEIVSKFKDDHEAMKYAFENRSNPNGRTIAWMASNLGIRRQRLSRMLNHGDYKLPASKVALFDFLTGCRAYGQFVELEKERLIKKRVELIQQAIEMKVRAA